MKVVAGFFSLTEVTAPTEHRNYNAWHMLDHLPEQLTLEGIAWGQRWVLTPACRRASTECTTPFDRVHYLTLYLLAEPLERTLDEFFHLGHELSDLDRFHRHRRTALTGAFEVRHSRAADRVLVSAAAVPYRPNRGIHVRIDEVLDVQLLGPHDSWLGREHLPALVALDGVAGAWTFRRSLEPDGSASDAAAQLITVAWLDAPPLDVATAIGALPEPPARRVRRVLDAPFATVEPYQWDWFDSAD